MTVPMEVFVSVDMEGIAGVTTIRQTTRGTDDYPRSRERAFLTWMYLGRQVAPVSQID